MNGAVEKTNHLSPNTVIMLFFKGKSERLSARVSRNVRYLCPTEAPLSPPTTACFIIIAGAAHSSAQSGPAGGIMLIMLYALYCLRNMRVLMPHPEIVRHKEKAEEALASLRSATTSGELRDAWEDFLGAFARTLGRLIKFAMETERTRAWAHRLKNASQKDNDVLVYLREARNSAEHGLEPQFATKPRTSTLGGFLDFEEGSSGNVHIESCSFEGVAVGLLKAEVEDGLVKEQIGDTVLPVGVSAAEITLQPIINE